VTTDRQTRRERQRRRTRRQQRVLVALVAVMLVAVALAIALRGGSDGATPATAQEAGGTAGAGGTPAESQAQPAPLLAGARPVRVSAVGDTVMGSLPYGLPADGGASFFSQVDDLLVGDVVLGNLEGTLATGGSSKCGAGSSNCFAFRTPPSYARWLARAGFTVMSIANNHAYDYGQQGLEQTIAALERAGLRYAGRPDLVTLQKVGRIRVATVGFAPYPWAASLTDIAGAKQLVREADRRADVVVVTMHAGAEGSDRQHVRPGTETFLGENRGDPMRFSHAVIDAGADLVVGSGPHVLRGMEWYKGRLIAYSLGNFAGYRVFSLGGPLSTSGILRVTLDGRGGYETGQLVATRMVGAGLPALDPAEEAHGIVRTLSREDFGSRAVKVSRDGMLR
jgi:hypothetical protein